LSEKPISPELSKKSTCKKVVWNKIFQIDIWNNDLKKGVSNKNCKKSDMMIILSFCYKMNILR